MKVVHTAFGALVILAFLLTGQYMDHAHDHLAGMPDGPRLLYRTRHIFVLLSGLLNLALGMYLTMRRQLWRRIAQACGSALVMLAPVLFVVGFFYEPWLPALRTPVSHWGTYAISAGVLLHVISGVGRNEGTASV